MRNNIGYHTRKNGQDSVKITGGTFGGAVDMDTVNRLVKSQFTVTITPSGRPVFVDKKGNQVSVYITVDPADTDAGKVALAADLKRREELQKTEDEKESQIQELMAGLSNDEIIRRLTE